MDVAGEGRILFDNPLLGDPTDEEFAFLPLLMVRSS
jgi:hypothetical protein